jgi:hypothetical protein
MLDGEQRSHIQAARMQREQFFTEGIGVSLIGLAVCAFASAEYDGQTGITKGVRCIAQKNVWLSYCWRSRQ